MELSKLLIPGAVRVVGQLTSKKRLFQELGELAVERDYLEMERIEGPAPNGVAVSELVERIPNNHLHYALTWFGLAATLIGVWAALGLKLRCGRG